MELCVRDLLFALGLLTLLVHCVKCNQYDAHLEDNEFAEFEEFDEGKFLQNFNCRDEFFFTQLLSVHLSNTCPPPYTHTLCCSYLPLRPNSKYTGDWGNC